MKRENKINDTKRDDDLSKWGITVMRYSNDSIRNNFGTVAADILKKLGLSFSDLKPL